MVSSATYVPGSDGYGFTEYLPWREAPEAQVPDKKGQRSGGEGGIARGRGRPLVLRFAPDRRGWAATSKNRSAIFVGRPVGMPDCRSLALLHGFIKKTQQTPDQDLDLAVKRKKEIENDGKTKE